MSGGAASRAVVLLPTYNERSNIRAMVRSILATAPVDIIILDDNSPDGTGAVADEIAADEPRVRVVHRTHKKGLGPAYIDGFRRALADDYTHILEMDADFSHPPEYLPTMLRLSEDYDLVLGSRWVPGGGIRNWPRRRQLLSRAGSLYARTWLGLEVADLTSGFKCFHRRVLEALDLDTITTTGYAFQVEVTARALHHGFTFVEMPFVFVERTHGASKMSIAIMLEAAWKVPLLRLELSVP